jgi:hypothetical protein
VERLCARASPNSRQRVWIVETLIARGRTDLAEQLFARLVPGSAQRSFMYRRENAMLDEARGRPAEAAASLTALLAESPTQGAYYEAMDAFHLGTSLIALGRTSEAVVHLDAARARWHQMGAQRRVDEVEAARADLG